MNTLFGRILMVVLLGMLCIIPISTFAKGNPFGFIFPQDCHPLNTLNITQCGVLIPNCAGFAAPMKW